MTSKLAKSTIIMAMLTTMVGACSAPAIEQPAQSAGSRTVAPLLEGDQGERAMWARLGGLAPQTIAPDTCGLFLWAEIPQRTLVFFADGQVPSGRIMFDGKQLDMPLGSADGVAFLGHFAKQVYEDEALTVTVSFQAELKEGLRGGAVIREGTWRIREKGGWELILPVAGLIGCN